MAFVSVEGEQDMALPQIPYLEGGIIATGEEVSAIWVEIYFVYVITVSIIMLNQSLTTNIPDLNCFVLAATCHACSIWMELD